MLKIMQDNIALLIGVIYFKLMQLSWWFLHLIFSHITICDWACENRACVHIKFAYFFKRAWLITFDTIKPFSLNFLHLLCLQLAL